MKMVSIAAGAVLLFSDCCTARAAVIDSGPVFSIKSSSDIYNPGVAGELVVALDFADLKIDQRPLPPVDDGIINGVPFIRIGYPDYFDFGRGEYVARTNFGYPDLSSGFWTTPTDDVDLDSLLDSHACRDHPFVHGPGWLELYGLEVGQQYSIQLIAIADVRNFSTGKIYEPDNGANVFTGLQMRRGDAPSVRGVFTADSITQVIQIRSFGGDEVVNSDPGLCGFVLFAIPEPCSAGLVAAGLIGLLWQRTR